MTRGTSVRRSSLRLIKSGIGAAIALLGPAASIDGTLTTGFGPFATTRTGSISDSITSFGDLYPQATLKWNAGVHNFMTYLTGDIPVGAYDTFSRSGTCRVI